MGEVRGIRRILPKLTVSTQCLPPRQVADCPDGTSPAGFTASLFAKPIQCVTYGDGVRGHGCCNRLRHEMLPVPGVDAMKLKPLADRIVIRREAAESKSFGGKMSQATVFTARLGWTQQLVNQLVNLNSGLSLT